MSARERRFDGIIRSQQPRPHRQTSRLQSPLDFGSEARMLVVSSRSRCYRVPRHGRTNGHKELVDSRLTDLTWLETSDMYQVIRQHALEPGQEL